MSLGNVLVLLLPPNHPSVQRVPAEHKDKKRDSLDKTEVVLENYLPKKLAYQIYFLIAIVILSRLSLNYIPKQRHNHIFVLSTNKDLLP